MCNTHCSTFRIMLIIQFRHTQPLKGLNFLFFKKIFKLLKNVYVFILRERESMSRVERGGRGGRRREGERESQADSMLSV